ncbi:EAL domain-containing response regulator [Sulfurimonas sp.]
MKELKKTTNKLNVLYVEDDEDSRTQIGELFKLIFNSVTMAFDGEDALEKYKLEQYDIVITDINMPRMDGLTLTKKIKELNPSQNIIILSAHNQSEYLFNAIDLGVDGFILKPIQMEQFLHVLSKVSNVVFAEIFSKKYHAELKKELDRKTEELQHHYMTDKLTDLLNKNALLDRILNNEEKTIVILNIDNFDTLYMTYGHNNNDIIIIEVANYLKKNIPEQSILYRIDNNEFAIVTSKKSAKEMQNIIQIIQNDISKLLINLDNFSIKITLSVGIAEGNSSLMENGYIALKEAQKVGKNHIRIYTKNSPMELLQLKIQKYLPLIRDALIYDNITPYYQAIRNNKTQKIEKYECLARIITKEGTVESPYNFINIAELTGMIPDITRQMIEKSFSLFQNNDFEFSINISEYDLNDGYLQNFLKEKSQQYKIEPSRVVLEVLEGISALGAKQSLEQLVKIKEDGYQLAIDDFGAQNSNFERVHMMQVDYIKIDGTFIKNLDTNPKSYYITKTITDFAKSIGAKVIAEYVHSKAVQDIVMELNIDYSQGYYFSEPSRNILEKQ